MVMITSPEEVQSILFMPLGLSEVQTTFTTTFLGMIAAWKIMFLCLVSTYFFCLGSHCYPWVLHYGYHFQLLPKLLYAFCFTFENPSNKSVYQIPTDGILSVRLNPSHSNRFILTSHCSHWKIQILYNEIK